MADEIDSRMEQIRLKNEELEKKHKEVLEDELEAKKIGAVVSSKSVNNENYKHPYDDIDLDYDVKEEVKQEHSKNLNSVTKNNRKPTLDKKSLDEIPPDPINFLREDQGDQEKTSQPTQDRPQQPQNQRRNQPRPRGPPNSNNSGQHNNNNNRNSSHQQSNSDAPFRPQQQQQPRDSNQQRNNNPRNKQYNHPRRDNNNTQGASDSAAATAPPPIRRPHPQALRNERRTVNATPNNAESVNANEPNSSNNNTSPTAVSGGGPKRSPHKQQRVRKDQQGDQRNDITIQLTDEVRSVKIKTSERVGSGRFRKSLDNEIPPELNSSGENSERPTSGDANRSNKNRSRNQKRNYKPKAQNPEFIPTTILEKIVVTKTSVQERLLKNRLVDDKVDDLNSNEPKIEAETSDIASAVTPDAVESNEGN